RPGQQDRDRGCTAPVKATANHIHDHGGEFVLPVKENRQALFDALDALSWSQVPIAHTATDRGHGRITTRTIQIVLALDNLPFPHVSQVFLIEWHVTDLAGKPVHVAGFDETTLRAGPTGRRNMSWARSLRRARFCSWAPAAWNPSAIFGILPAFRGVVVS